MSREQNWFALYWQFSTFYSWQKKVKGLSYFYVFKKIFLCMFSVCIKSFMLPFNNILVSPPHAQSQHFTFSKIKIDSQEKSAHNCCHQTKCAAASSCLNIFWPGQKICNSGSRSVIAACKISSSNVSNEASQSQSEYLMFLTGPVIVLHFPILEIKCFPTCLWMINVLTRSNLSWY